MKRLTARMKTDYFRRSYEAIDGLWFMKLEEDMDFERALEYDRRVWEIVPKIQCRKIKDMLGLDPVGLGGLSEALTAKFAIEGFACSLRNDDQGHLIFEIKSCPWFEKMKASGREHLAARVGQVICQTEYQAWAREFGKDIRAQVTNRLCDGRKTCTLDFSLEQ
jgi:hypothetical protein